jgi:hypothetical protein
MPPVLGGDAEPTGREGEEFQKGSKKSEKNFKALLLLSKVKRPP